MKKILKKLKSKKEKGSMALLTIFLIPFALLLFSSVIIDTSRKTIQRQEVNITIDSFCEYVNEKYGKIYKLNGKDYCNYSATNQTIIKELWNEYFSQIDGYNSYWKTKINFADDLNQSFTVICDVYFPRLYGASYTVDRWGIYVNNTAYGDGYYASHSATMRELCGQWEEHKTNNYWTYQRIEVSSSCL